MALDFDYYQKKAKKTAVYPAEHALAYLTLGLVGEAAETANKVKKIIRGDYDHDPRVMELVLEEVAMELGDTLWYLAVLADELDVDLSVVGHNNLDKLRKRQEEGTLKGSGDDR